MVSENISAGSARSEVAEPMILLSDDHFRLSPQQKRLWQFGSESTACRIRCVVEIEGALDRDRLRHAVQHVSAAYTILRTRFVFQPGIPLPLPVSDGSVVWEEDLDLEALPSAEQESCFERIWAAQTNGPSSWEACPALKLHLVKLGGMHNRLLLHLSPLCGDSFALGRLVGAIASAYAALPEDSSFPDERLPYFQFAAWQNELLETPDAILDEATAYWASHPIHALGTGLPVRRNLPAAPAFTPECISVSLETAIQDQIMAEADRTGMTEAELLFASWCAFLGRWTGNPDTPIWCLSDGRSFDELREVMGLVARYVPVTGDRPQAMPFHAFAAGIRERLLEALEWQDYLPIAPTSAQNNLSAEPLDLAFEYEEWLPPQSRAGLVWSIYCQEVVLEPFQLKLVCVREGERLRTELNFDARWYAREEAQHLLHGWLTLIRDAMQHPDKRVDRLQLLDEEEQVQLCLRDNETARLYPDTRCFHELFEAQAMRTPEAVAIRFGKRMLTYQELNVQADKLAAYLENFGIGVESRVGICLSRSPEMVIAILGILKAGGTYIPLDASYPLERLGQILEDAVPSLVLTQTDLLDRLPASDTFPICMDSIPWDDEGTERRGEKIDAENLAYVIYTSGSTGRPKGVMIPHRGLVNYLHWCTETYRVTANSGTLVDTPIGFDLTITSLLSPLMVGQTAILLPEEKGIDALVEALQNETDITLVKTTPSHLEILKNLLPADAAGTSRLFVIGGEALRWETLAFWRSHAPDTRLVNEYGPTETVVGCCVYDVSDGLDSGNSVPIGRPIANTRLYLLDSFLQLVPMGMPGELYIGGIGVARGYLDRPDLTAERFLPDPFSQNPGARLYKTGDLCRSLPDGNLEYLGRTDHQVKIRGFRIELGEIESVLMQNPGVQEALVQAREDVPGDRRLVAYLVASDSAPSVGALRTLLQEKLPEYMVPTAFVFLPALPLTANGKVDRKALPIPEAGDGSNREYVAPRTPLEEEMAEIWSEVLRLERVGIYDNFFELGGHSLLATQVFARVRDLFQVELPLRLLFETPTLGEFAERVTAARGESFDDTPALAAASRQDPIPLSFSQQRLWLIDQLEPGGWIFNMPLAFRVRGSLDVQALQASLQEIVRRHEVLRTTYPTLDDQPIQKIFPETSVALDILDLSDQPEPQRQATVDRLVSESAQWNFDLERGPLFRTQLLRLSPEEHLLLLVTHHIAWDGWSNGIFLREWSGLYNAFLQGQPSPLPELPLQYADYAIWQRDWIHGKLSEAQLAYWRGQLSGANFGLPLQTDRPETVEPSFEGGMQVFTCPVSIAEPLKELARQEKASLYMVLLAAFNTLLHQDMRQEDICVGTPVSGRRWTETESLIGLFLNTLVMRTDLSGNPTFRALVRRVRQTVLTAHANQDLPFEQVVDALKPRRDLSHTPLFRLWFVVHDSSGSSQPEFSGISLQGIGSGIPPAKYALWMSFSHTPDGLRGSLIYRKELFDAATIIRLAQKMEALLAAVTADPDIALARLTEHLTEVDRKAREEVARQMDEANQLRLAKVTRTPIRR